MQPLTPERKTDHKKREVRRRRERQRREEEYRKRIERLRRQIEEARRRRQRLLVLFILVLIAMQESLLAAFARSFSYRPDPAPDLTDWTPDPRNDYAPRVGHDDYCDGYCRAQWDRMLDELGVRISRKAELKTAWEADPERELFPERYQLWGSKPYIGQIMNDLTAPYWQADALVALKILSPPETHQYLDEAYATDPGDIRQCLADRDSDIIRAFQTRAALWDEQKRRDAEAAKRDREASQENDGDQGIPKPK